MLDTPKMVLVPVYWSTPLILWDKISPDCIMFLFGARPADASLVPGEVLPEGTLRVLKALADPTRLKILRYLSEESMTPAQLSRRLRLRPPTVIHHLSTLRLAGLVRVTVDSDGTKQYAARMDAYSNTFARLGEFLQAESKEPIA
jgi:DNA-binding transcriptional ArsR family regulator